MLTTEESDGLCRLARGEKIVLTEGVAKRLIARGYIERSLGSWLVTPRGHAMVLRAPDAPLQTLLKNLAFQRATPRGERGFWRGTALVTCIPTGTDPLKMTVSDPDCTLKLNRRCIEL